MYNLTIITAYIEIPKKKYDTSLYLQWINNYMNLIKDTPLVIYTNSENIKNIIENIRKDYLNLTKIINVDINSLHCYKYIKYFENDYNRDNERYHDPLLYLIWNNKTAFMYDAYNNNYFNTDYYAWTDIGMIRDLNTFKLLNNKFPNNNLKIKSDKVYLLEIEKFENAELNYNNNIPFIFTNNRCGGGVILCSKYIIKDWFIIYYNMLDNFIENNIFSGKDQNILNNIYIKYRNNLIELIIPEKNIIDKWFYMLYYISIKI